MHLRISGSSLENQEKLNRLLAEKLVLDLDKLLGPVDEELRKADVGIEEGEPFGYKVHLSMSIPRKEKIYAEGFGENLEEAIINLREKVLSQIRKYRKKVIRE